MQAKKGFTLIELLVVLAIVAILSVVVILTLNPAELLKQARDSNRLSDLGTLKSAISLYLADVSSISMGTLTSCYVSVPAGITSSTACGVFGASQLMVTSSVANYRKVDITGWVPINLTLISSGAPIGNLPVDPLNTSANYYAYAATSSNNGFELTAILESTKYTVTSPLMSTDGGGGLNPNGYYQTGTNLNI